MSDSKQTSESIKCVVRCRPLNDKEKTLATKCISISSDSKVIFVDNKDEKNKLAQTQYAMDKIFDEDVTQEQLFNEIGIPLLNNFLSGYNCTIFCYGQTGAGKTYTMIGPFEQLYEKESFLHGLIPRIIHFIFNENNKVNNIITNNNLPKCKDLKKNIKICVMEIYQESIIDLLNNNKNNELKIKEDPKKGMYIQNINEVEVFNAKEAKNLILTGLKSRHVAATEMNAESSRSHLLFSIYLNTYYKDSKNVEITKNSRLHLIDLAGSERQKKTKVKDERIKEACMINKSLSTLGNVINALVEKIDGKNKYIPFRDSKLTYFLKDSLGGNSKTTIVANISCSIIQINETISTLKFVQRAKMIKNSVSVNMNIQENIESLHEEIKMLKDILKGKGIDISLINKDYICPICNNQPIEIKREEMIQNLKNEILNLTEKLVKNFQYENEIKKLLLSFDGEIGKNYIKFFDMIDQYKNDYENGLKNLDDKVKNLNEYYKNVKNDMQEANKKIINYNPDDPMDRVTFDKVNNLNNLSTKIINKFKDCDIVEMNKLKMENKSLKNEIEISKEVKKIIDENNKNKKNNNKDNLNTKTELISNYVEKFIKSNDEIKKFMSEHFLGEPMLNNEIIFLEKSKYEMLLFQLDEEKITSDSLRKRIEDMESENYLVNLELSKMKNNLDSYNDYMHGNTINGRKRIMSVYRKNTPKTEFCNDKINEDENKNNSISNKLAIEIVKMKESLEELNDELDCKITENDELQGKIIDLNDKINELNLKIEEDERNNKQLKEQIEAMDITNELYEDSLKLLAEYKMKSIKDSTDLNNEYEKNQESSFKADLLRNEIFDMYNKKCFELFEKLKISFINEEYLKDLNKKLSENLENYSKLNNISEEIIKNYKNKCNELFRKIKEHFINEEKMGNENKILKEIINDLNKNFEDYITKMDNNINGVSKLSDDMLNQYKNKCDELFEQNKKKIFEKENLINLNNHRKEIINNLFECNNEYRNIISKNYINMSNIAQEIFDKYKKKCDDLFNENKNSFIKERILTNINNEMSELLIEIEKNFNEYQSNIENKNNEMNIIINEINEKYENKCNDLFNKNRDLIIKNAQLNNENEARKEIIDSMNEVINKYQNNIEPLNNDNNTIIYDILNKYQTKCNELFEKNKSHFIYEEELKIQNKKIETIIEDSINYFEECLTKNENNNNQIFSLYTDIIGKYKIKCVDLFNKNKELFINEEKLKNQLQYKNKQIQKLMQFIKDQLDENNSDIDAIVKICDINNNKLNELLEKYNKELNKIQKYYKSVYLKSNKNLSDNLKEIISKLNTQINSIDNNEDKISSLVKEMNKTINDLMIKLELKEQTINKLQKEKQNIIKDKEEFDNKNTKTINELQNDINNYKNKLLSKDNIIKIYLDQENYSNKIFIEIYQCLNDNNNIINKLNNQYNENLSGMKKFYNNVVIKQNTNNAKILNENEKFFVEIFDQIKKNDEEINNLEYKFKNLNEIYYDKCCSLLNVINKEDVKNNTLNEKILNLEIYNKKLIEENKKYEEKNKNLIDEKKNLENANEIYNDNITNLKKEIENNQNQMNKLNEDLLKYMSQLKEKDEIIDDIKSEKTKLNLQITDYQNENKKLSNNIESKNELIKTLQEEINKYNKNIDEYNQKYFELMKTIENLKKQINSLKEENKEKNKLINQLNEKSTQLFSEISNKNNEINKLNTEQNELAKNIAEINDVKNEYMSKINEKEEIINSLQKNNEEINKKCLEINQQNNNLLTECENKSNEISQLNELLKSNNEQLSQKELLIIKLNAKIKQQKSILASIKSQKLQININPPITESNSEFFDKNEIINEIKEKNKSLYLTNIENEDNLTKINMKYNLSKILLNLNNKLSSEFTTYQQEHPEVQNIETLIDIFINEKIDNCTNEIKITENELDTQTNEKNKINTNLLSQTQLYFQSVNDAFTEHFSNLNNLLTIFNEETDEKKFPQIIQEFINDINQYLSYGNNYKKSKDEELINIEEIKKLINIINEHIIYKKAIIDKLSPIINFNYNTITKEEISNDQQINYYEYKIKYLTEINNTSSVSDLEQFLTEHNNYRNILSTQKEKILDFKNKYTKYKNILDYVEKYINQLLEEEFLKSIESTENSKSDQNSNSFDETEDEEEDEEDIKIKTEITKLENNITNEHNLLLDIIKKYQSKINDENEANQYLNIFNACNYSSPNVNSAKLNIILLIESRDNTEKKIDNLKLNYLILNNLPNQYNTSKNYLLLNVYKERNNQLVDKLKIILGNKFDENLIYENIKPEIIWNKAEIPKLTKEIMILKEEKHSTENDLNALRISFELALKGNSNINNNQLVILFRIKEENKKLKDEIKQIKDRNKMLQEKIKELNMEENNKNNTNTCKNYNNCNEFNLNISLNEQSEISNNMFNNRNNGNANNGIFKQLKSKKKLQITESRLNTSFLREVPKLNNIVSGNRSKKKYKALKTEK